MISSCILVNLFVCLLKDLNSSDYTRAFLTSALDYGEWYHWTGLLSVPP
jgi:hypothetical protein